MEPIVIKKAKQFVSFENGDVQLLDIMSFFGVATSLDSFLKAYKTAETKGFFPYEWFDCPQKMNNSELPPYHAFFSKLRKVNPLEKDSSDYQNLLSSRLKTEEALSKMKLSKPPPSGEENCQYLLDIWHHENMQQYPYSMCQPMPTGLYTRWEYNTECSRFKPQQNKSRNFEIMVKSYFQRQRPDCKIESFYNTGTQKKIDCFKVEGFCAQCKTVFEAMGCFYHYCPCQEARPSLTDDDIESGNKKREMDQMRKQYIKEKGYNVVGMWECEWWNLYKTTTCVKDHLRESFPYKHPLREESLLEQIRSGKLFGSLQCDIEVSEELKEKFANFPTIFKNTNLGRHDIGSLLQDYAEKEGLLCQPRKMLISSCFLENGTLITPLLLFLLEFGLVWKKTYRFVEYTPVKCFNNFVQSAVNARLEEDENPNSSVVAETIKLLANSSYGYQFMDRSRHTVTKFLND